MSEVIEKLKSLFRRRHMAYHQVFDSPVGREVLIDLARFCRAHESTFHENERIAHRLDGRREVWLRIQQHLQMDSEALWSLYNERMK